MIRMLALALALTMTWWQPALAHGSRVDAIAHAAGGLNRYGSAAERGEAPSGQGENGDTTAAAQAGPAAPALPARPIAKKPANETRGLVTVLTLVGPINPVAARYVTRGLATAQRIHATAVVLQLDTPGGLDSAMREIIQGILGSPVPVVVYVSPAGARAASAGMYIAEAAQVAAMAPDTAIGAAHPVGGSGEDIRGVEGQKVTNDAAAYMRGLAARHGRNVSWAEKAVRQSLSAQADEALQWHVVDAIAPSLGALLDQIDGLNVVVQGRSVILNTRHATLAPLPMNFGERLLYTLSHPELALILLNLGILGIVFELQNPTGLLAGIAGVIFLLVGLFALDLMPVNWVGVALMIFGLGLFLMELFVTSFGLLTVGGVIALILGAMMAFQSIGAEYAPTLNLVIGLSCGTGLFIVLGMAFAFRAQRRHVAVGAEDLPGRVAVVRQALTPAGMVFLEGELWQARALDREPIAEGEEVTVERVAGLTLWVRRKTPSPGK